MPEFNVPYDSNFDAHSALLYTAINAANEACPNKREQLLNRALGFLGFSPEEISAINIIHKGEVSLGDVMTLAKAKKAKNVPKKVPLKEIPDNRMQEILLTIYRKGLIRAENTWQFICYWLARNCKGWTGGIKTQLGHLQNVLGKDFTIPKRAFRTDNPKDLDKVLNDPQGKMGRYHYDAIKLLEDLCDKENLHKGV